MIKNLLSLFLLLVSFFNVNGQDFSNKGKDFWVGYGNHVRMFNSGTAETMQIYLTSDVSTTGTVAIASIAFSQTFSVTANQITVVNIPRAAALLDEGLYNHGIHITALKPIVAYGFIYVNAISGATVFLPTNTLGKEYYGLNYTQVSNEPNSYSYFFVEAVETGSTVIEITPSQTTKGGWPANVTQTITLTQGQIYQVLSTTDLTGSTIKSIASGTGGCKKIAVFCGSGKISIGCSGAGSSDNLYQQMYPASTWGKKYVLIPTGNRSNVTLPPVVNTNYFRVYRPDATSIVNLNGTLIPSSNFVNNIYQFSSNQTNLVEADKSILVAQYFTTAGCGGNSNPHDPDMIYLNPVEQTVSDVTVNSMQPSSNTAITQHFINVVLRNSGTGVSSFKIDGVAPAPSLINVLPQDNNYAYLRIYTNSTSTSPLSPGAHRLSSDSGFNAIAYGFGSAESYGYSAGTNLKDLFQQISVQSQYGIESSPSVCTNSPFRFRVSLPYCADSIQWDLSNLPGPPLPANPKIYYSSCSPGVGGPDSTTSVSGKTIYWYSLPKIYTFPTAGLYPVTITAYNTGATQCGSAQDIDFELGVFDPPIAGFTNTKPGCVNDPVQFTDTTITLKPNYRWAWNFDDPGSGVANTSIQQNPVHVFSSSGPHSVTLTTTTIVGCLSGVASKVINIPAVANATISGTTAVCQNAPQPIISFTITDGLPPYKLNYTLAVNGGAAVAQTPVTTSTSSNTISVVTATVGTFVYSITSIENANATFCTRPIAGQTATVTVNPLPTATIAGSNTVCQNSTPPNITFTGSNGAAPYTFTYSINGGSNQTATTTTSNSVSVTAPTSTTGTYIYSLVSVQDAASCIKNYTNINATIIVKQLPTATISTNSTTICQAGTTLPLITFTGAGGLAPYTFLYTINGSPFTISTTAATNTVSVAVSTLTPGTFIYNLVSVKESSILICSNNQTGTVSVIVQPKPTASFTTTGPFCELKSLLITPAFGIAPIGTVVSWVWDYGDGTGVHVRTDGNPFTLTYAVAGIKIITFKTVSDNWCVSDLFTLPTTIFSKPKAGFINPAACLADAKAQFFDTSKIPGGSAVYWEWAFGDGTPVYAGNTSAHKNPTHTYLAVGQKTVKLIVTSNSGCIADTTQQFFINGEVTRASFTTLNVANLCSNRPVQIKDNSIVNVGGLIRTDIYWDYVGAPTVFDQDNNPITNKIYTHNYQNLPIDKVYKVRYYAYSGFNGVCQKDTLIDVLVHASPVATFSTVPNVCLNGGQVMLNQGTASGGAGVYTGPGVTFSAGVYTFNPLATGVVVGNNNLVVYTVTSSAGCDSAKMQQVKVLAPPIVNTFAPVGNKCLNNTINFRNTYTDGDGTVTKWIYNWNDGSPLQIMNTGADVTHVYTTQGTQMASLTLETGFGCRNIPFQVSFTVNPLPLTNFTFSDTACLPNAKVLFNNTTSTINDWAFNWNFDFPSTIVTDLSTQQQPVSHTYFTKAPHSVKLVATSAITGCTNSIIKVVNTIHPAPVASFNFNKASVCLGQSVTVIDNSIPADGSPLAWLWNYGETSVSSSGQIQPPYSFGTAKTFNVKLTFTNSFGCVDDTTRSFVVYPYPVVDAGPDDVVLEGGTFNIAATATGNNLTYLWTSNPSPTYLSSTTILNPFAKPLVDITYKLTVTAQGGCVKADSVFIKVLRFPEIPNTFTPNNDGIHDFWEIKYLFTYPGNKVQVFTRTGQKVFESNGYAKPWDGNMNGKSLPFDTYYYIIEPGSGRKPITGYVTIVK